MKNILLCICFFIVSISIFDFFKVGNETLVEELVATGNMDTVEDSSAADEDDEKEFLYQIFISPRATYKYEVINYSTFSKFTNLHSPPPKA